MTRSPDLRRRGEKSVLVKREGSFLSDDEERNYSKVVQMEDVIEVYRDTYAKDLEKRLNLNDDKLHKAMSISMLLNPIFGLKPRVVGCGLMSDRQYDRARKDLVQNMQDIWIQQHQSLPLLWMRVTLTLTVMMMHCHKQRISTTTWQIKN